MGGGPVARNVQTTLIPAGGATIVEFKTVVPGRFLMVDHSLSRALDKGAVGSLVVEGEEDYVNIDRIERIGRVAAVLIGLALLALAIVGPARWWGLVGLVPLAMGVSGW